MQVPIGPYRGPGGPDPKKTINERAAELHQMMQTSDGQDLIRHMGFQAMGIKLGQMGPIGSTLGQCIDAILKKEYPEPNQ